ncbi:MAG TPA: SDR family oxidoreductase [Methylomirabilota bacterium]|nr:SDR family oxidoreductase [Methylomirabilota bacterium]
MTPRAGNRKKRPRALVTGGAVRLGRAIALALADAGCDVAIGYLRSGAAARATVRELRRRGATAVALRADLRRADAARRLVAAASRALGGLDVLVNNAALFYRTPLDAPTSRWDALLDVDLRAPLLCSQAAVARMRAGGHIVNVGDAAARGPGAQWSGWSAYVAAKAGLEALTRALAAELRPRGIAVNCVAPGPVLKPERLPAARWRVITRGRAARPAAVVRAIVRLTRCPPSVTGKIVVVTAPRSRAARPR